MVKKRQAHKRIVLNFMKDVFDGYEERRINLAESIAMLEMGKSNFFRYLKKYRENKNTFGIEYIRDVGKNRCDASADEKIASLLRSEKELILNPDIRIGKYNFEALAQELKQQNGIDVAAETVRRKAIIWKFHHPKERTVKIYRELETTKIGRLFQHDTCIHQWSPFCKSFYLILTVDDHSRMIVHAKFYVEETSMNHILSLRNTLQKFGMPIAYYTDRHSIFTFNRNNGPHKRTYQIEVEDAEVQWKRVLAVLQIQAICAQSPQAKGKVESKFKYLQGRVVRRCAKEEVTTMEHAQQILDEEVQYYNECRIHEVTDEIPKERFERAVKEGRTALRPLNLPEGQSWKDIFCLEYEKKLDSYGRTKIKGIELQVKEATHHKMVLKYIEENGEKEIRIWSNGSLLKVIKL